MKKRFSTFYIANKPFSTTKTKSQKIGIFPKGLVHGLGQKIGKLFNNSFYAEYTQKKKFRDVLVREQVFLDNININSKKCKIDLFAKWIVRDFGQKVEVFSCFVFINYRMKKSVC